MKEIRTFTFSIFDVGGMKRLVKELEHFTDESEIRVKTTFKTNKNGSMVREVTVIGEVQQDKGEE